MRPARRWGRTFTATTRSVTSNGTGTALTESFDAPLINVDGSAANFEGRYEMVVEGVGATIANVKAAAEA